jgi:hypothetical protein
MRLRRASHGNAPPLNCGVRPLRTPFTSMIRWETCRRDFEPDGALRDIYVQDTTIDDWRGVFDMLRRTYDLEFLVDSEPRALPTTVDEAFAIQVTASPILRFRVGGIVVISHFFIAEEIDFDIHPSEVTSQAVLDELLGFLRRVGDTVGRAVILTHESDGQHPFITYEPSRREFQYHEFTA